jgi:hypothetical protein
VQIAKNDGFLHTVKDPLNPSDTYVDGDYLRVILDKPSDNRKLSDPLHSVDLFLSFSIKLDNSGGGFDLIAPESYFNRPVHLYKTWKDRPSYADFVMIRTGIIDDISITGDGITFSCAEKFRTLEQNVCKIITGDEWTINTDGTDGKSLPVVFGVQEVPLIKIFDNPTADEPDQFLAAEYITSISGVYNSEGEPLSYTLDGLVITAPPEADYARITGYTNNRLGDIVVQLVSTIAGISYIDNFWDVAETDAYKNTSPRLDITIKSGTVRSAVNEVLKSDTVFLIQKNNALFTLRRWGTLYGVFSVDEYLHTLYPSKNWKDAQKYWFSSCIVKYAKNGRTGEFTNRVFLNKNENVLQGKYSKKKTAEFETCLTTEQDARAMAERLSERFNFYRETVSIGIGKDTSAINPLDTVLVKISVNGRLYSNITRWIVKEIDPAQDKMTLEEI